MRLFVTTTILLLIILVFQPVALADGASESVVYKIDKSYVIKNFGDYKSLSENLTFYAFDNREEVCQKILDSKLDIEGDYEDVLILATEDNRRIKVVALEAMSPGEKRSVKFTTIMKVGPVAQVNPASVEGEIPDRLLGLTKPVNGIWHSNDPKIKNKALELTENETNYWYKAKRNFDFVQNHLSYSRQLGAQGDLWAYNHKMGDCSEYANLFISLARAAGIPAKFVSGYFYSFEEEKTSPTGLGIYDHAFAIIYLPGAGWVPVDPTEPPQGEGGYFAELPINHIAELTSDGTNMTVGGPAEVPGAKVVWSHYRGRETNLDFERGVEVSISPLVAAKLTISGRIRGSSCRFTVKVSNEGALTASNVNVDLQADNNYFDIPPAKNIGDLNPGVEEVIYFDVNLKNSVENSLVKASAIYEAGNYGRFKSSDHLTVTATLPTQYPKLPMEKPLIILIVAVAAGVGALAVLRR